MSLQGGSGPDLPPSWLPAQVATGWPLSLPPPPLNLTRARLPSGLQVRYKEEFEKNKGKGFSVVADTPELQRIKKTQDQISNVSALPLPRGAHRPPPLPGRVPSRRADRSGPLGGPAGGCWTRGRGRGGFGVQRPFLCVPQTLPPPTEQKWTVLGGLCLAQSRPLCGFFLAGGC